VKLSNLACEERHCLMKLVATEFSRMTYHVQLTSRLIPRPVAVSVTSLGSLFRVLVYSYK
jgi:hypothetical protein